MNQQPDESLKPENIPYNFYVTFYLKVLEQAPWTWNLRLRGRRHKYEKNIRWFWAGFASLIVSWLLSSILLNGIFPSRGILTYIQAILKWLGENWLPVSCAVLFVMLIIRGIVLCCCAWSEYDPYLRAGLALHTWKSSIKQEQSAQTTQPEHPLEQENNANGIPNELAASLSRVCNPMCWGYAMRLYCEKALIEADKKTIGHYLQMN